MRLLCLALILLYSKAASAFTTTTVLPSSPLNSSLVNNGTVAIKPTEKPNQNCYVCYSCSRVETSQSLVCPKGMNQCIVSICLAPKMLCGRNSETFGGKSPKSQEMWIVVHRKAFVPIDLLYCKQNWPRLLWFCPAWPHSKWSEKGHMTTEKRRQ